MFKFTTHYKAVNQHFFNRLFCVALLAIVLVSCKKDDDPELGSIVFWSSNQAVNNIKVDCYVDNKLIGTLKKVSSTAPSCDDANSPVARVAPGAHTCEFRAANGQTINVNVNLKEGECQNVELF